MQRQLEYCLTHDGYFDISWHMLIIFELFLTILHIRETLFWRCYGGVVGLSFLYKYFALNNQKIESVIKLVMKQQNFGRPDVKSLVIWWNLRCKYFFFRISDIWQCNNNIYIFYQWMKTKRRETKQIGEHQHSNIHAIISSI